MSLFVLQQYAAIKKGNFCRLFLNESVHLMERTRPNKKHSEMIYVLSWFWCRTFSESRTQMHGCNLLFIKITEKQLFSIQLIPNK